MASIAELIDFLMNLMRDDDARREFDQDPDTALADHGLAGVSGQDVRDARLMMADSGAAHPRAGRPERGGSSGEHDAVREIHYTAAHFEVGDVTTTVVTINDNDTVIVDSFNNDVTAIQDNDTTDVDVISVVDNDNDADDGPEGDEGDGPEGEAGDELDPATGSGADEGAAPDAGELPAGSEVGSDDELTDPVPGSEGELDAGELDSGASEGFAPDQDSGFGAQSELGTEAGFTSGTDASADESFDELVG